MEWALRKKTSAAKIVESLDCLPKCPNCGSERSRPRRLMRLPNGIGKRWRKCDQCSENFYSLERIQARDMKVKTEWLRDYLLKHGVETSAKVADRAAKEAGFDSLSSTDVSQAKNDLWPERKRRYSEFKTLPTIDVLNENTAVKCPYCSSSEIKVQSLSWPKGLVRRKHKCLSCQGVFFSKQASESGPTSHEQRRFNALFATEKTCTRCEKMLPIGEFAKLKNKDFRHSHCRDCRNDNRAAAQLKQNLRKYGLTIEQFQELLDSQKGGCAICGEVNKSHGSGDVRMPVVFDHCHATGEFRGLLCQTCNRGLGLLGDNAELVAKAASYLAPPNYAAGLLSCVG